VGEIHTDFPERFSSLHRVRLCCSAGESWEEVEQTRLHKNRVLIKFVGRDTPDEARELVGCEVQVPESERVKLPDDTYFDSDLIGCQVYEDDRLLGTVIDVLKAGGQSANLVVRTVEGLEFMVPTATRFLIDVDVDKKMIRAQLPPGLIELAELPKRGKRKKNR
jgi:16S rRNA processing protein RimM